MNIFQIAWRSVLHRGFGSFLTICSMALGVMLVVSVLSIHGLVSDFFYNNSSFGYNILVGARGGALQLTMNTVYYLSQPVENVPYEYYLAFCDKERRQEALEHSLDFQTLKNELETLELIGTPNAGAAALATLIAHETAQNLWVTDFRYRTQFDQDGMYHKYTSVAIPMCLGDSFEIGSDQATFFRCVGTTPEFFSELVLDIDSEEKFKFAAGRPFIRESEEYGFFECVLGAMVAKQSGLKVGDKLYPTHGDPNDSSARVHDEAFTVVGILEGTRTPHDRAVFLNMEGFFLMDDHAKPIDDGDSPNEAREGSFDVEPFEPFELFEETEGAGDVEVDTGNGDQSTVVTDGNPDAIAASPNLKSVPLPLEQREVTSILIRTSIDDEFGIFAYILPEKINEGTLEATLDWSNFRPVLAQKAVQAVNPVVEVTKFLQTFIGPIQWLLLALTAMICVVSAISILVGIYNSMSQRQHEIAIMRALGASRSKVMSVMLIESILLAGAGGLLGWICGHLLNVAISPLVERQTGVGIGFLDIAPPTPMFAIFNGMIQDWTGWSFLPEWLLNVHLSPEVLLIPGLVLLSILVGIYPAISAYRTDVAKALGK